MIDVSSFTSGIKDSSGSLILGTSLLVMEGDLTLAKFGLVPSKVFKSYFLITGTGSYIWLGVVGLRYEVATISFSGALIYLTLVSAAGSICAAEFYDVATTENCKLSEVMF